MSSFRIFIILLSIKASFAFGQAPAECPNIDLRSKGGTMEHVTSLRQELPNCFFHTIARMNDAWRFSHGDTNYSLFTDRTSLVAEYCSKYDESVYVGGIQKKFFKAFGGQSLNLTDSTSLNPLSSAASQKSEQFLAVINQDNFGSVVPKNKNDSLLACKSDYHGEAVPIEADKVSMLKELVEKNKLDKALELCHQNGNCVGKSKVPLPRAAVELGVTPLEVWQGDRLILGPGSTPAQVDLVKKIKKILFKTREKTQPIAIGFCNQVTVNPKQKTFSIDDSHGIDTCANHAALIVGMEYNKKSKTCNFLIQNSFESPLKANSVPVKDLSRALVHAYQLQE